MFSPRSDLAIEAAALFNKSESDIKNIEGIKYKTEKCDSYTLTTVEVLNSRGEEAIGKKIGTYITIDCPKIRENDDEAFDKVSAALGDILEKMLNLKKYHTVLAVGLGNWNVTPDALGPKVVSKLLVTRHLFEFIPEKIPDTLQALCAISPGVLGITGIETSEIVKGICDKVRPDVIIAIDALASRKIERISTSIQISDTGITPGAGIGNKRRGLDEEYLGARVIAIGVPTVVDAATVANDTIEILCENIKRSEGLNKEIGKALELTDNEMRYPLIKEVLNPFVGDLIVTPKEVDEIIDDVSKIIANGINRAVHKDTQNLYNA